MISVNAYASWKLSMQKEFVPCVRLMGARPVKMMYMIHLPAHNAWMNGLLLLMGFVNVKELKLRGKECACFVQNSVIYLGVPAVMIDLPTHAFHALTTLMYPLFMDSALATTLMKLLTLRVIVWSAGSMGAKCACMMDTYNLQLAMNVWTPMLKSSMGSVSVTRARSCWMVFVQSAQHS
jgi:hypothetical protein